MPKLTFKKGVIQVGFIVFVLLGLTAAATLITNASHTNPGRALKCLRPPERRECQQSTPSPSSADNTQVNYSFPYAILGSKISPPGYFGNSVKMSTLTTVNGGTLYANGDGFLACIHIRERPNCTVNNGDVKTVKDRISYPGDPQGLTSFLVNPPHAVYTSQSPATFPISDENGFLTLWRNRANGPNQTHCGQLREGRLVISGANNRCGPQLVNSNLKIDNDTTLTITGPIYVTGTIEIGKNTTIQLDCASGTGTVIAADGPVHFSRSN